MTNRDVNMKDWRIKLVLAVFFSLSMLAVSTVWSQPATSSSNVGEGNNQATFETVPVEVDGRQLFELRGVKGYPASGAVSQRAFKV